MLENLALFSLGEVGSASEFPLGNAEGGGDSLSVKKILSFRGNVERHTFELPREERNAISAKEEPGDLDMGRGHLWEGDFHVHSVPWGKFKGVLTGWYQPSDRERRWEFRSLRIPETWGQRNTDNYFVVGDSKLDQKIVKERGMDTLSQTFVEGAFRQGNRETNTLLKVSMLYEADLFKTRLVRGMGTGPVEKLTGADRRRFLTLSFLSDVDRMSIRKWMKDNDLVRRTGERDLAFASRVQTFMVGHFVYNGERRMSIEDAIRFKGIACGESALLFGKIMRMNGIPARSRAGRWTQTQEKTPSGGDDIKVHVKVDFYAEGIGWLVVEFPYGEKNPQKIDECIGWDGDFLTIQIDPFVSKGVGVVFDQGFRGYSKGIVQPLVYEWWEVNSPKD